MNMSLFHMFLVHELINFSPAVLLLCSAGRLNIAASINQGFEILFDARGWCEDRPLGDVRVDDPAELHALDSSDVS